MDKYLLITLGHGASAVFIGTDGVTIGYEQERLDGIKSSSAFPHDAICEIIKHIGISTLRDCVTFVSHWFNTSEKLQSCNYESKYITSDNFDFLKSFSKDIIFVDDKFTHHDAHAFSACLFFKHHFEIKHFDLLSQHNNSKKIHTIVADGFGNNEEVISIYENIGDNHATNLKLIKRVYGFENSLGLMYQYATSFCGMKENQDEYKFLGYEAHIDKCISTEQLATLNYLIDLNVTNLIRGIKSDSKPHKTDDLIDKNKLMSVKDNWWTTFSRVLSTFGFTDCSTFTSRTVIAYFIQKSIEDVLGKIISMYNIDNIIVTGGIFYNVKLNNIILKSVKGLFSVMPLAGDQGAAFGMYNKYIIDNNIRDIINFKNLCIGKRTFRGIKERLKNYDKAFVDYKSKAVVDEIVALLKRGEIVNIVTGDMEFGPRALCNTTSLFLPTLNLVNENNRNNNRNEVMPCAPVIKIENGGEFFDHKELERVVGSDQYMICTHRYMIDINDENAGAAHNETLSKFYSGRPQLISSNHIVWDILNQLEHEGVTKILVNTSFNAHGKPIAFDTTSIVENYEYQVSHSILKEPYLFVIL